MKKAKSPFEARSKGTQWKCRRCGMTFLRYPRGVACGIAWEILHDAIENEKPDGATLSKPPHVPMCEMHFCQEPQGLGVADLIGIECQWKEDK